MHREEIRRKKLIKFIKSNNPFHLFSSFEGHSTERLEEIKRDIEIEIRTRSKRKVNNG